MSDAVEKDTISFEDTGEIANVPVKDDVETSKIVADETQKIKGEKVRDAVRVRLGEEPKKQEPVGTLTKDVPQLCFRIVGGFIGCKKFELDDAEAQTYATHLNILFPVSGKMISVVVLVMITLNKVYVCMDALKLKFGHKPAEEEEKQPDLPEQLS